MFLIKYSTYMIIFWFIDIDISSRHPTQQASVWFHALDQQRHDGEEQPDQQTHVDVNDDYSQICDHENYSIQYREFPDFWQIFDLE